MKTNATYADKFSALAPWFDRIISSIRRECKQEHLKADPGYVRKFFNGKPLNQISVDEMKAVYADQIVKGHEQLGEFVANRWIFKHLDLYRFFERKLNEINPNFDQISELSEEQAEKLINEASKEFGLQDVFIFVTLNSVALPETYWTKISDEALDRLAQEKLQEEKNQENQARESVQQAIQRISTRFEDKLDEQKRRYEHEIRKLQEEVSKLKKKLDVSGSKEVKCHESKYSVR